MASNANTDLDKLLTFGQMALEQGWYDQKRDYFEQALALDASNREAIEGLAQISEILGRRMAVPVEPIEDKPVVDKLLTFGQMALEQGWYDKAREYFEQVLASDASNREAVKRLTQVNEILSRKETIAVEPIEDEPVEPAREYVEWLEKCPFCKEGRVYRERKPIVFGRFGPALTQAYVCDFCATKLSPLVDLAERKFQCVLIDKRYPEMQVYHNAELTREELIRISEGGRSDLEQERLVARQREAQLARIAQEEAAKLKLQLRSTLREFVGQMTYREAIERAQQATVGVGIAIDRVCSPLGSGAVIAPTGLIITNAHVAKWRSLYCITRAEYVEGETYWYYNAQIVKWDGGKDLALLRIESLSDGSPVSNLSLVSVPLGNSDKIHTGDTIYVCGYPGVGGPNVTVTKGLVSGFEADRALIKTDTEISPGSSGGVAIAENGLLIGIPTIIRMAPWGFGKIGYLIAVNEVRRFLQSYQGQ